MTAIAQPSFTSGELAPALWARIDLARFYTGLKTCRNFIVRPYGGVMNRAGTYYCAETKNSAKKSRLIEFIYSSSQSYALEVGENYIRFITNGGYVLDEDGDPVEVATPYLESDLAVIKYVQSADVLTLCNQNYKQRQLNRFSHTSWTLTEFGNTEGPFLDINTDESKTILASAPTGTVTLTANFDAFPENCVGLMLYLEQGPDDNTKKWDVATPITINSIRRRGVGYYQAVTAGTTGTVAPTTLEGTELDGDPGVKWQYLHSGYGIVKITARTNAQEVTATVMRRLPEKITGGVVKNVADVDTGIAEIPDPPTPAVPAKVRVDGHGFPSGSIVTIADVVGATEANGEWTIQVIDANWFYILGCVLTSAYVSGGTATLSNDAVPSYKWAFEAWGGDQKYPGAVVYYQQRQVFGGSVGRPQHAWMSRSGGFTDFGQSNPLLDDDSISFEFAADKLNNVRHFVRMKNLIALTSEAVWLIQKEQGKIIPMADPQEDGGASHVRPLKIGKKAIYVEDKGGAIRSLGYEFSSDTYEGQDLTITASHLFFGKEIVDWAYQKVPFRCVWIVLNDGSLVGLTYLPDQDVIGWHRHDTDGLFESVCCVPEGAEDVVYAIVKRTINGVSKRYVEKIKSRFFTDIKDAFFVDCGLTYDGRNAGAAITWTLSGGTDWDHTETLTFTTGTDFFVGASDVGDAMTITDSNGDPLRLTITEYTSAKVVKVMANRTIPAEYRSTATSGFDMARNTFSGLSHIEGKTVSILADGNVEPQKIVTGGTITLDYPATVVHVGLPIEADIETLDINTQGQSIQDRVKNVRAVTLIVEKTRGLKVGPDENNLLEYSPEMSGNYDLPIAELTGPMQMNITSDWSLGGRVMIRQDDPLPASILAAIPEVAIGGS